MGLLTLCDSIQPCCAPPPGAYDPKHESKVKGAALEKSDRFVEPKVSTSSGETLSNASTCSGKSASHLPVFRTCTALPLSGSDTGNSILASKAVSLVEIRATVYWQARQSL
uniref:Uncharacterized protein n=1 Tax=Timema bartmani TaxID=61472 RepID=A0A7R9HZQ0_9NEOP|nr:unnamed protein product [Timema bartmani]